MMHESPPVGTTLLCTIFNVAESLLNSPEDLVQYCEEALHKDSFTILSKVTHTFDPQGFTCVWLLAESHLALHTYPEHQSLTLTLYSCRGPDDGDKVITSIVESLEATDFTLVRHPTVVKRPDCP